MLSLIMIHFHFHLDQMNNKKVFSTLDAKRSYWQIEVHEPPREKTAFVMFEGLHKFKVMPLEFAMPTQHSKG